MRISDGVQTCALPIFAADGFLSDEARVGYRIPYDPPAYPWGSNSTLLNRAILLALAADITGKPAYRDGVIDATDYVLGRNPLDRSFVSGFGARPMTQPHHRFWAHAADAALPPPPPGQIGRAHVCTPVTNAHLVCPL